jgi:signal transduction histidine kinase
VVSATPSPSADDPVADRPGDPAAGATTSAAGATTSEDRSRRSVSGPARPRLRRRLRLPHLVPRFLRRLWPRSLQGRLTLGFAGVVALSLLLVTVFVLYRLDDEFRSQQVADLEARSDFVFGYVDSLVATQAGAEPVVFADGSVNRKVLVALTSDVQKELITDRLAESDVDIAFGMVVPGDADVPGFQPVANGRFHLVVERPARPGLRKEALQADPIVRIAEHSNYPYVLSIRLSNPYTFRQTAIDNVTTVTAAVGVLALGIAVIVAAALALRVTTPLRRLTQASQALAEGDLSSRVPRADVREGSAEVSELAAQFNAMADRLEESVAIIRRDRDRSRDFLADVSHELRTPIAALLTFNELLTERAGDDPAARAEFLASSRIQLERLDWLAQNLLELSKLDSGLVLLDLRPDDLRVAVESAVEQARPTADRKDIRLDLDVAPAPIRIRHDPQRIGQVVTNLVGNAVKFTEPGGAVHVRVEPGADGGGSIEVSDTGVGIEPEELPHIFERFYRGNRANEARASGSGLGLAIVRSIVDIHHGTIGVESRLGTGTRFTVALPNDPRDAGPGDEDASGAAGAAGAPAETAASSSPAPGSDAEPGPIRQDVAKMADSSPSPASGLNRGGSG